MVHNSDPQATVDKKPRIDVELMLTGQYFNYAKNIWGGKLSDDLKKMNWYLPKKNLSYAALLEKNISKPSLAETEAVIPQYSAMKNELARYKEMEKKGTETVVPSIKKPMKPGDSASVISYVRKRLYELGDLREDNGSNEFDPALTDAVNQFKTRHGLKSDSIITGVMIADLNVPIKKRIEQMMVNMERFRWIPVDIVGGEYILVNIPGYMLYYYEDGKIVWDCSVVVGTPMNKTVIFTGNMQYIVFSPYWYIPKSILNKEIIPGIRRNRNYLARHGMEWNGGKVRQKPGPSNSLGLVKFLFPNSNNIYLHDTPSKSLFGEDQRAFSHGCIRVSKPKELALRILRYDSSWNEEKVTRAMNAGVEKYVTLKKKIPVHIGYFTAFVDRNGLVNFRKDIYQRDASMLNLLMQN
jgi:L,D-transpeptidase YcbB